MLDFETRGLVGADLTALDGLVSTGRPKLYRDGNLNGTLDRGDPEVTARFEDGSLIPDRPVPLLAAWSTGASGVAAGRIPYRFFVTGAALGDVRPRLRNRSTGETPSVEALAVGQLQAAPTGWHPWRYVEHPNQVRRFAGSVRLSETVQIPASDTVVVSAGTTFLLEPDVSFISRGAVRFEGTLDRPIRFVSATPGRPWGAFSLLGPGADGSIVQHTEFIEGGGALVDRIEFTGMVNVHRAHDVLFDTVLFRGNRRSDDSFHALHSHVSVINSRFVDANSDAVDFDISSGEIRNNVFEGGAGDAIDLMTSSPQIIGNRIRDAGDKGISVGEASAPVIFGNLIEDSAVAIEIKDRSAPILLNNELRRSGVGLGSSVKNWRYGGSGFGFVANTRLEGNTTPLDADLLTRLTTAGVAGLDPSVPDPPAAELRWLYRRLGFEVDEPLIGLPGSWRTAAPILPMAEFRFVDDFGSVTDEWVGDARVTRLEKRQDVLVLEAEGGPGLMRRDINWDLAPVGGGVLVVELAGQDVQRVRIEAHGALGMSSREVNVPADASRFVVIEVPLSADRYHLLTVELEPTPGLSHTQRSTGLSIVRSGRLFMRSLAVYPERSAAKRSVGGR